MIENSAKITVKNRQLVINTGLDHSVAIEDITAILIENRQSTISTAALSELGRSGCIVLFCDDKHMPCAVLEPFHQYSRELPVIEAQLSMTEPQKKRLWQCVVKRKIENQAKCLALCGKEEDAEALKAMSLVIHSGDPENHEAIAAQRYFPALFGNAFHRGDDSVFNSALNYGYSIIRSSVARNVSLYGLNPTLGIHHKSTFNSFNLVDDLMEPFRPIIDLLVFTYVQEDDALLPELKRLLFNSLNLDTLFEGKRHSVAYAIELMIQSFSRVISNKNNTFELPFLLDVSQHKYE